MDSLTERIWERALDAMWSWSTTEGRPGPGPDPLWAGDVAIHSVLLAHGVIMNGGVLHAVECLGADELAAAEQGYAWLGLPDVANLLRKVSAQLGSVDEEWLEVRSDAEYADLLPEDDDSLEVALRAGVRSNPEAFAPFVA